MGVDLGHPAGGLALAAVIIAAVAGPVIAAVTELLRLVLIIAGVLLGLALAAVTAFVVYRLRHPAAATRTQALWYERVAPAVKPAERLTEPRRALERPAELHIHLHGLAGDEIEAILSRDMSRDHPRLSRDT